MIARSPKGCNEDQKRSDFRVARRLIMAELYAVNQSDVYHLWWHLKLKSETLSHVCDANAYLARLSSVSGFNLLDLSLTSG